MDENQKGIVIHQVFMVSKEEGLRMIAKAKTQTDDANFIAELERINNQK